MIYKNGVEISDAKILYCRTSPEVASINNRTLGGLWFFQTIGSAGIKADVAVLVVGMVARDEVLDLYAEGSEVTISFDGYERKGYILSEPNVDVIARGPTDKRIFQIEFSLGINIEVSL